jgi:hypothetical protein
MTAGLTVIGITGLYLAYIYVHNYSSVTSHTLHDITGQKGPGGEHRYSPTHSLTSALDGVGRQHYALAALTPRKRPMLGVLHGRPGWLREISPPPGFDPQTVHPVANRCTDYALLILK